MRATEYFAYVTGEVENDEFFSHLQVKSLDDEDGIGKERERKMKTIRRDVSRIKRDLLFVTMAKRNLPVNPCKEHKIIGAKMSYREHSVWAAEQLNRGLKQKQCKVCQRWLFPEEF